MNTLLRWLFTRRGKNAGLLLLRLFAGGTLLPHGLQKLDNFDTLKTTFANPLGLGSELSLVLITSVEIGGSILIMLGLLTRPAAFAAAFGMFVAAFLSNPAGYDKDSSQLPLLLMGIFLALIITGAGSYSLDEPIRRKLSR
ncbi:MAG: DoxX family protein [Alistipes sp.]|nr:DoxX family protein [Alistipes sp.]